MCIIIMLIIIIIIIIISIIIVIIVIIMIDMIRFSQSRPERPTRAPHESARVPNHRISEGLQIVFKSQFIHLGCFLVLVLFKENILIHII